MKSFPVFAEQDGPLHAVLFSVCMSCMSLVGDRKSTKNFFISASERAIRVACAGHAEGATHPVAQNAPASRVPSYPSPKNERKEEHI